MHIFSMCFSLYKITMTSLVCLEILVSKQCTYSDIWKDYILISVATGFRLNTRQVAKKVHVCHNVLVTVKQYTCGNILIDLHRTLSGSRVRVELSNGEKRTRNRGPPPSWSRRPRDDHRGRRGSPPARRR